MNLSQSGILAPLTEQARYLVFSIRSSEGLSDSLRALAQMDGLQQTVVGLGLSLIKAVDKEIPGLRSFPVLTGSGIDIPSTPAALWCWLRGTDRGDLYHRSRKIEALLYPAFSLDNVIDSFQYKTGNDMTGYEDGTENPQGEDAINAALVQGQGEGLDGSSFVAVQQWLHDFDVFDLMTVEQQDNSVGRQISDNEEIDDAPVSAHVKRTAQEDFDPEAFLLRRSMPWSDAMSAGLNFVAFGKTLDAFEAQLNRMIGQDDGVVDALFDFTQPLSGSYFWCPPVKDGHLDLSILDL
ncbi:MAG: Dyp-type peroxidase [Gammaproteobacteria bacterium]|nr:Dyp-type peroxidase [Gammaproteobacteria bacterium]